MLKKIAFIFVTILTCSQFAFAGTLFTPGSSKHLNNSLIVADDGYLGAYFEEGRSYCCDFHTKAGSLIFTFDNNTYNANNGQITGTTVNRSSTTPSNFNQIFERRCLFATSTHEQAFKFANVGGNTETATMTMHCVETSLYGGYNTNAARYNFLEILNTTNSTINLRVNAKNFDGTTVINNAAYSVQAGRRLDVDLHTPAGLGKYGLVKITHDGPFGALQAGVSFYKADFTQTTHVPLKVRDQVQ